MEEVVVTKTAKKVEEVITAPAPETVVSFDEFVTWTNLPAVWADGLQVYLAGQISPRTMTAWQTQLSAFQSLA